MIFPPAPPPPPPPMKQQRKGTSSKTKIVHGDKATQKSPASPAFSAVSLKSLHWEEDMDQEQAEANRAIDEFLATLIDEDYVSENGSTSSNRSLVDD